MSCGLSLSRETFWGVLSRLAKTSNRDTKLTDIGAAEGVDEELQQSLALFAEGTGYEALGQAMILGAWGSKQTSCGRVKRNHNTPSTKGILQGPRSMAWKEYRVFKEGYVFSCRSCDYSPAVWQIYLPLLGEDIKPYFFTHPHFCETRGRSFVDLPRDASTGAVVDISTTVSSSSVCRLLHIPAVSEAIAPFYAVKRCRYGVCEQTFTDNMELALHAVNRHLSDLYRNLTCQWKPCNTNFTAETGASSKIFAHLLTHIPGKLLPCEHCGQRSDGPDGLRAHRAGNPACKLHDAIKHLLPVDRIQCPWPGCIIKPRNHGAMYKHILKKHAGPENTCRVPFCLSPDFSYLFEAQEPRRRSRFRLHIQRHFPAFNGVIECNRCLAWFSTRQALQLHQQNNTASGHICSRTRSLIQRGKDVGLLADSVLERVEASPW